MNPNEIATKQDIQDLAGMIKALDKKITAPENVKTYSINQLVKMGTIGKGTRIRSLIKKGIVKTTADGRRILDTEVKRYLNNQQ